MELLQISKNEFLKFVEALMAGTTQVIGVVKKDNRFIYDILDSATNLTLDYDETLLPPKTFVMPPKETLLTYKPKDPASYKEIHDMQPRIIIGIHPGDCAAIALLDRAFSEGHQDGNYCSRRKQTTLIGMYPTRPFKYRFTSSMVKGEAYKAADAMLIDCGDGVFGVEVITEKAAKLFKGSAARAATPEMVQKIETMKHAVPDEAALPMDRDSVGAYLSGKEHHEVWEKRGKNVFPADRACWSVPRATVSTSRTNSTFRLKRENASASWDGCTIENFATAAGGHNFRKTRRGQDSAPALPEAEVSVRAFRRCPDAWGAGGARRPACPTSRSPWI
jgi:sulfhydrogenase subunit beta (sulfur reductase)